MGTSGSGRLNTLDGVRGAGAGCVVLLHATTFGVPLTPSAYLAPDLFFLLSGFVIALAYEGRLGRGSYFKAFAQARIMRLYPLYLLGWLIAVGAVAEWRLPDLLSKEGAASILASALFIPGRWPISFDAATVYGLNPPAWSLLYEMIINLAFAASFRLLTTRRLLIIATVCGGVLVVTALRRGTMQGGWNFSAGHLLLGLCRVGFGFPLGVALFRMRDRLPASRVPNLLLLLFTVAILALKPPLKLRGAYELLCLFGLFPVIVIAGREPAGCTDVVCVALGRISYPIYILHFPILALVAPVLPAAMLGRWGEITVVLGLFALALAADEWFDRPIRDWLSNQLPRYLAARPIWRRN